MGNAKRVRAAPVLVLALFASACSFDRGGISGDPADPGDAPDSKSGPISLADGRLPDRERGTGQPDAALLEDAVLLQDGALLQDLGPPLDQTLTPDKAPSDVAPTPDQKQAPPDSRPPEPDLDRPSCIDIFNYKGVPSGARCWQSNTECGIFFDAQQRHSCNWICNLGGRSCSRMYNTNPPLPMACNSGGLSQEPCSTLKYDALCVCAR